MRLYGLLLCGWMTVSLQAQQIHDWENHHVLQINREPARAAFVPFAKQKGDCSMSLDGMWKFRWTPVPSERITDFYRTDFNDKDWKDFPVPANWEINGYGTPIYVSAGYPFKIDPPRVMGEPKASYTTYKERNPVGQYRRTFTLPAGWKANGQTFLRFEGVMSAFYVWINGERIGYSQGSMEPSEFNITRWLKPGENQIALEVYRYSDGSYLEDQDFWRFGGVHRSIHLVHTPDIRIRDYVVRTLPAVQGNYQDFRLLIDPQLSVYTLSDETRHLAWLLVMIHAGSAIFLWPAGFVLPNALRAANDVRFTMLTSILSMGIWRLAFSYILCVQMGMGAVGVWIAMVVDWVCRVTCFVVRFVSGAWKKKCVAK